MAEEPLCELTALMVIKVYLLRKVLEDAEKLVYIQDDGMQVLVVMDYFNFDTNDITRYMYDRSEIQSWQSWKCIIQNMRWLNKILN